MAHGPTSSTTTSKRCPRLHTPGAARKRTTTRRSGSPARQGDRRLSGADKVGHHRRPRQDERRGRRECATARARRRRRHDRPVSAAELEARADRPLGTSRRSPLVPRAGRGARLRLVPGGSFVLRIAPTNSSMRQPHGSRPAALRVWCAKSRDRRGRDSCSSPDCRRCRQSGSAHPQLVQTRPLVVAGRGHPGEHVTVTAWTLPAAVGHTVEKRGAVRVARSALSGRGAPKGAERS